MSKQIKCDCCNKWIRLRLRPEGIPNIVGFGRNDGTVVNICYGCICKASYDKHTLDIIKNLKGE